MAKSATSGIRGETEGRRERLVALVLLLQAASREHPLTQERIVRELKVDEFPVTALVPRKVPAYEGNDDAVRQKFERDKSSIREFGFQIETEILEDGGSGYWIDPQSVTAPAIFFTDDETRVVQLALALCGFGRPGAFSVFSDGPAADGGLEFTNYFIPILRALHQRRALTFDYQSSSNKSRLVEPLVLDVFNGITYLVARIKGTAEVRGFRLSRLRSMPVVLPDSFHVDEPTLALAKAWRPEFSKSPKPTDVVLETNDHYAQLIVQQFPNEVAAKKKDGVYEVGLSFASQRAAMRFALEAANRVRIRRPKVLREELLTWLDQVNRGETVPADSLRFSGPATNDVLGETLRLLHAVYLADDGLRISELAKRFSLSPVHVRLIMDRLVALQPIGNQSGYLAHLQKECDDWDDVENDDSTYRADFSGMTGDEYDSSPFTWLDLFELNVALREASRVYVEPAIFSAIEKIESTVASFVQMENAASEPFLADVREAVLQHEQLKINYTSASANEPSVRIVEPREIKVLNGRIYMRAYCTMREGWRTFRVDRISGILAKSPSSTSRPADTVTNWLTEIGEAGDEVVVIVESELRWLFEPLPNAQWCVLDDGRHAVKFRISERSFLDHLMLRAGPGAVVLTPTFHDAGHELARRIAKAL